MTFRKTELDRSPRPQGSNCPINPLNQHLLSTLPSPALLTACASFMLSPSGDLPTHIQSQPLQPSLQTRDQIDQYLSRKRAPESKRRDTPSLVGVGRSPETGPRRMWACFREGLRTGLRRTVLEGVCGRTGCGSHCGYLGDF